MKKRFAGAFLVVAMLLSLLPVSALAAETTLPPAVDSTIKLTDDVTLSNGVAVSSSNFTIDLNGHTLKLTMLDVKSGASLTLTDTSTNKDGKLTTDGANTVAIRSGGTLILEAGTIENVIEGGNAVFNMGTLTVKGGTVTGETGVYNTAWNGATPVDGNIICNIEGGTVDAGIWGVCVMGPGIQNGDLSTVDNTKLVVNISGGTIIAEQGIAGNASSGTRAGFTVNMTGGTIKDHAGAGTGMYLPSIGTTNISGGSVSAAQAIRIGAGELNITGGTITCTAVANGEDLIPGGSGGTTGAIVVGKASTGYVGDIKVNVSGNAIIENIAQGNADDIHPTIVVSDKNMANTADQKFSDPATGTPINETYKYSETSTSVVVNAQVKGDIVKISALEGEAGSTQDGGNTTLEIAGGNITGNVINQTTAGNVTVSGGMVTGNVTNSSAGEVMVSNATVIGTVYNSGSGSAAVVESDVGGTDGTVTVVNSNVAGTPTTTDNVVAMIGAKGYNDLPSAIDNASTGDTVKLIADVTLTSGVLVDKKITLDLNGHKITNSTSTWSGDDFLVAVKRGGDLTINDSVGTGAITTETEAVMCGLKMTVKGESANGTDAILTVNGGTIQGYYYGISGNGTRHDTVVTINGGTITTVNGTDGTAIYHPQDGEMIINGGTITSDCTGIEIRSGSLTVNGGTISGGNGTPASDPNGNGTTTSNTGIAIAQHTTRNDIVVNINGGTISGGAAVYESNPQANNGTNPVSVHMENATLNGNVASDGFGNVSMENVTVTGSVTKGESSTGSMTILDSTISGSAPASGATIVNSYVNGELTNSTPDIDEVALVNGVVYADLQTAINAANAGDTVTLLRSVILDGNGKTNNQGLLTIDKNIILNGNGKTLTAENITVTGESGPSMVNVETPATNVTIKNLTIDGGNKAKHGLNIYQAGTVTLENVTVNNNRWYAVVDNASNVVVNGLTTSGNQWGINVDSKNTAASLTVSNADISEASSIVFETSGTSDTDPTATISGGSFQYIVVALTAEDTDLTISGGSFATGTGPVGAINVGEYLAPGLAIDGSGNVYTPSYGGGSSVTTYATTVESTTNGTVTVSPKNASKGSTVTIIVKPNEGYVLNTITVTDKDGNLVDLTKVTDTKYTFKMPASKVTVKAAFVEETPVSTLPFTDVAESAWYYDAVVYVYENGMMTGTNDGTTFSPSMNLTRGMMAQVMFNIEKGTAPATGSFADVAAGAWYADAVNWAATNGIVGGYGNGTFGPEDSITREQMAVLLYNYAKFKGEDMASTTDLSTFSDGDQVSDWAQYAMKWAVAEGLISGSNNALNPLGTASRAEVAQILMNYFNK